jgi:hypothetical protein
MYQWLCLELNLPPKDSNIVDVAGDGYEEQCGGLEKFETEECSSTLAAANV